MTKKGSHLSSRKHSKRPRPIDTASTGSKRDAQDVSVAASASATIRLAKRGRVHSAKSSESTRSKPTDRRSERFGARKAKFEQERKVADAGRSRSPGRQKGGGVKAGSVRARAASMGVSKSSVQRWDEKKEAGVYAQGHDVVLLDQRGGSNRRFSAFIEALCLNFVERRVDEHARTRSFDVQAAIVAFERAFPLERPKHASRIPKIKTVREMLRRIDVSKVKPSPLTWSTARPSFQAEVAFTLSNVNRFRPSQIWFYDEMGVDWLPVADDTLVPKGMHASILGKEQSRGSTVFIAVNKHSVGRWARRARFFVLHHHPAKPASKTRAEHCPLFKLGLACDCTAANGEPGVDVKGLHASTLVSIAKLLIQDGQRSDEQGGRNGLRRGDAFVGDLLPQHYDPEVMRLYSLAGVWALFMLAKTPIVVSPLDNAGFAILKQHVHSKLQATYALKGHVGQSDVDTVVPEGVDIMLQSMDSMFSHCRVTGDINAPAVREVPAVQTTQLPFGTAPPRSKPPSKGLGKRKQQPKAPTKRAKRRAKARAAAKRVQSETGEWLFLSPVKAADTYGALLLAVARSCDPKLNHVARKARTGDPKGKRAAKREPEAAKALQNRVVELEAKREGKGESKEATTIEEQLQRLATACGRRLALYTPVTNSQVLSRPR